MVDSNKPLIIIGSAFILLIIAISVGSGLQCKKGESFMPSDNAEFTVSHPKYVIPPNHPQQRLTNSVREGFMVPIPSQRQTLTSSGLHGSTNAPTSNPWLGGLTNEINLGVSVPGSNTTALLSGNGSGNVHATDVWRSVL